MLMGWWSSVIRLFLRCRPTDVAWLIVALVIDAVKTMSDRWAWPDMVKKGIEVLAPFMAHRDSSSAIAWIAGNTLIETAIEHSSPRTIFRHAPSWSDPLVSTKTFHAAKPRGVTASRVNSKDAPAVIAGARDSGKSRCGRALERAIASAGLATREEISAMLTRILITHRMVTPFGVTPRAVHGRAGAFAALNFTSLGMGGALT